MVPFSVAGVEHALVAAVLADEHGIGVRSGFLRPSPFVAHLLGLDADGAAAWARQGVTGRLHRRTPASCG